MIGGHRVIDADDVIVPGSPAPAMRTPELVPYREAKARFELDYYTQLMRTAGGNVSRAAKLGQKTRKEIYDALRRCGLDVKGRPSAAEPPEPD
jgi:DNA-binding NtrC family response regulator